jgi:hypothetical protein
MILFFIDYFYARNEVCKNQKRNYSCFYILAKVRNKKTPAFGNHRFNIPKQAMGC